MKHKPLILISLLLAAFVINLDTTIVNVALPTLVRELHASNSQLQWVVDAFNLLFAASVLAAGSLSDRFGRKGMLLAGLSVFGLASLAGGLTDSSRPADRGARGDGRGCGDGVPVDPVAAHQRVHRAARAGARDWSVGRDHRCRDRARADRRRLAAPAVRLAQHLLRDDADRCCRRRPRPAVTSRPHATRTRLAPTVPGSPVDRGGRPARLHDHRGPNPRLGKRADDRQLRAHCGPGSGVRRLGAAHRAADARPEPVREPRFTAASASVAISFFALSGFIFLVTQYFQFLKGYGPLSTGVRLLPVASCVAISSIVGTRLAVRLGTKLVVALGLFLMAVFYLWVATTSASTGYGTIAAQMVVLGTGMGLTSAPATEAIMGVVPKTKAGVGSAVNDATRLLGGTLGVAVIGSIYASLYVSRLTGALATRDTRSVVRAAQGSVGAAFTAAGKLAHAGHPALAAAVHDAATSAFFDGFHTANSSPPVSPPQAR